MGGAIVTMMVPARVVGCTLVAYMRNGNDPMPDSGNCFSIADGNGGDFRVINMRAEPFEEIVAKLGLNEVDIEVIRDRFCNIIDQRIPKYSVVVAGIAVVTIIILVSVLAL